MALLPSFPPDSMADIEPADVALLPCIEGGSGRPADVAATQSAFNRAKEWGCTPVRPYEAIGVMIMNRDKVVEHESRFVPTCCNCTAKNDDRGPASSEERADGSGNATFCLRRPVVGKVSAPAPTAAKSDKSKEAKEAPRASATGPPAPPAKTKEAKESSSADAKRIAGRVFRQPQQWRGVHEAGLPAGAQRLRRGGHRRGDRRGNRRGADTNSTLSICVAEPIPHQYANPARNPSFFRNVGTRSKIFADSDGAHKKRK